MKNTSTLFDLFGGIRPMARTVGVSPSNVSAWKRVGRIPAEKQPLVLAAALTLGLDITAENIIFPLGRLDDSATIISPQQSSDQSNEPHMTMSAKDCS